MHSERGPVDRTFVRLTDLLSASLSLGEPPVSGDATVARDESSPVAWRAGKTTVSISCSRAPSLGSAGCCAR